MNYRFDQKISKEDYLAFITNHVKSSFLRPFNVVLFTITLGYLLVSPFILEEVDYTFLFIALGLIALLVFMVFSVRKKASREYEAKPQNFEMTYEVNDDGILYVTGEGQLETKWIDFFSAKETEAYLYLYVNKNQGMVFVKNQIPSDIYSIIIEKIKNHVPYKRLKLQ